jgi:predicted RNA methylase
MDIFSNLMLIGECLLDARRTVMFQKAINKTVTSSDVVLDVGTGSGILAMMAARAGAKHVYAFDIAPDIAHFARSNIKNNAFRNKISVQTADAKQFTLKHPVDVVTMELMDTWLVGEQQAVALNQLRKNGVINASTQLIPSRYQCAATLITYDFSFYGFSMPFTIQARNNGVLKRIMARLSPRTIVKDIDLKKSINTHVNETMHIPVTKNGQCNALMLEAKIFLTPGVSMWGTTDMNMPVIIPVKPRNMKKGQSISFHMSYDMGEGFKSFNVMLQ